MHDVAAEHLLARLFLEHAAERAERVFCLFHRLDVNAHAAPELFKQKTRRRPAQIEIRKLVVADFRAVFVKNFLIPTVVPAESRVANHRRGNHTLRLCFPARRQKPVVEVQRRSDLQREFLAFGVQVLHPAVAVQSKHRVRFVDFVSVNKIALEPVAVVFVFRAIVENPLRAIGIRRPVHLVELDSVKSFPHKNLLALFAPFISNRFPRSVSVLS